MNEEEKQKKEKESRFNLKEILENKRKKAGLSLGLYFIFFILVFVYIGAKGPSSEGQSNNVNKNIDNFNYGFITYNQYTPLMNDNYKYKVTYNLNFEEKNYEGERKGSTLSKIEDKSYIVGVKDILNINSVLRLIKKGNLAYKTQYTTGGSIQEYNVSINDFIDEYNIGIVTSEKENIVVRIYSNDSYVNKVYFDLSSLGKTINSDYSSYIIEVNYSDLNSIK